MEQHKFPVPMSFLLASPAESRTSGVDIMDVGITKDRLLGCSSPLELEPEIHFFHRKVLNDSFVFLG